MSIDPDLEKIMKHLPDKESTEWMISAKKSLDWFLHHLGDKDWDRRKKRLVAYFKSLSERQLSIDSTEQLDIEDERNRYAFHEDWIAWYLYLMESVYCRPFVDDPWQAARVYPFFAAIGRHLDAAKNIKGIDQKLDKLLLGRENQPDSLLFEIVVAILYVRNGWTVEFVPESPERKTTDLLVKKDDDYFYVECKRLAKVTGYSECERKEWRIRWQKLISVLIKYKISIFVTVTFKVEVSSTSESILADSFLRLIKEISTEQVSFFENDELFFLAKHIDMDAVHNHFEEYRVRANSPQMVALLADDYESSGSYTFVLSPTGISAIGPEGDDDILNLFYDGVHSAYCAKWECVAEMSIDKKAKDVRKLLSKAVNQAPESQPTIVHIAYETLHGPIVEFSRSKKIKSSIEYFDYKGKNVQAVYCHALQMLNQLESWECAETTLKFGRRDLEPTDILCHESLLDEPGMTTRSDTHWNEDLKYKLKLP